LAQTGEVNVMGKEQVVTTKSSAASGTPLSIFLVGTSGWGLGAFLMGWIDPSAHILLGAWLFGMGIVILIGGIIDLMRGDIIAGTLNTYMPAVLNIATGMSIFFAHWSPAVGQGPVSGTIDGWFLLAAAAFLFIMAPVANKVSKFLVAIVIVLGISVLAAALGFIVGSGLLLTVAGIGLIIFGFMMFYIASAILINTVYGRPVVALPGPGA